MLYRLDPVMKGSFVVVFFHPYRFLTDDGSVVDLFVDEVHGNPCHFDTVGERLLHGVRSGKCGQQRRMDVDDSIRKAPDRFGCEDPHETGQHDRLGAGFVDRITDVRGEQGSVGVPGDHPGRYTRSTRALEASGVGSVGDHKHDPILGLVGIDQSLEVRSRSGDEDGYFDGWSPSDSGGDVRSLISRPGRPTLGA